MGLTNGIRNISKEKSEARGLRDSNKGIVHARR